MVPMDVDMTVVEDEKFVTTVVVVVGTVVVKLVTVVKFSEK
jgi:hypothetical protein